MSWEPEDAEIRRNALRLYQAVAAAEKALQDSDEFYRHLPPDGMEEERAALAEHDAKMSAIRAKYAQPTPLTDAFNAADRAYREAAGDEILVNDDEEPVICAACGFAIFECDEYVEDPATGEHFLRAAVGLPPRKEQEDLEEAA